MSDPLIDRFADACGATAPLNLRVDLAGGCLLAEGSLAQPFTLVGRDDSCDVTLSDPDINPRHAWLQVLGGRVFAVDLGSRTGLKWPTGECGSGWLDVGTPVRVGPFLLQLNAPLADRAGAFPATYNPLASDAGVKARPSVVLEFRNGKRARDRWAVSRLITLVGRSPDCKIHLNADDISPYHCGLVSTRSGLWVVDLSGRGVVVNGERMRVAPLPAAAELWVGRFLIGCQYQTPPASGSRPTLVSADRGTANAPAKSLLRSPPVAAGPTRLAEDEVELGAAPDDDDLTGSPILADPFRPWDGANASGPPSHAISVSGSGPTPGATPVPADGPLAGLLGALGIDPADGPLAPLLRQMADLHARTANEFDQWLALAGQLLGRLTREQAAAVQTEFARIGELTAEIAVLQSELARRALDPVAPPEGASRVPSGHVPSSDTPAPARAADTITPPPARSLDRLHAIQLERGVRWQAVATLLAD